MMTYSTIEETTQLWVSEFNRFPLEMIQSLSRNGEHFREITIRDDDDTCYYDEFPMWGVDVAVFGRC